MLSNQNEKCLLKYISGADETPLKSELFNLMLNFGIKLKFIDNNPVYKIIDELTYGFINGK